MRQLVLSNAHPTKRTQTTNAYRTVLIVNNISLMNKEVNAPVYAREETDERNI